MKCYRTLLLILIAGVLSSGFAQVAVSQGIPRTLSVQGVLTDAFESKPLQGKYIIKTGVYESALGGIPLYEQMDTLTLGPGGLYQIILGKIKGLPTTLKFDKAYFIDLAVNGMPQTMRIPLHPAPYALMASNVADNAVSEENLSPKLRVKLFPESDKNGENTFANSVGGLKSVIAGGDNNATTANYSSIIGGFSNRVSGVYGTIGGGQENLVTGNYGYVGGGRQNRAQALNSSVLAGFNNIITASSNAATIGGGEGNNAGGSYVTVSGGQTNTASFNHSTIAGGLSNRVMQMGAVVSGGTSNTASGPTSVVAGGTGNQATALNSTVSGGTTNKANGASSVVGGGTNNLVTSAHGGIFNGQNNDVTGAFSSIVGGFDNLVSGTYSSVGGGEFNTVSSENAVIAGGESNNVSGAFAGILSGFSNQITNTGSNAVITGGRLNAVTGENASISGGISNRNTGKNSAILGGNNNFVTGISSTVGGDRDTSLSGYTVITGGSLNEINISSDYSSIGGGVRNTISTSAYATIAGGIQDSIMNSDYATIAGGSLNTIREGSSYSLVASGLNNDIYRSDTAAILSGVGNTITEESDASVIASGLGNVIRNTARLSVISGGQTNDINKSNLSVISGGRQNQIRFNATAPGFTADYSVIAGGYQNVIDGVDYAFIGGGRGTTINRGSSYSAVLSGQNNGIGTSATHAVVVGGFGNTIGNSSSYTSIGGGNVNTIGTSSSYTTISGGSNQTVGNNSPYNFIGGGQSHQIGATSINNGIVSGASNIMQDDVQYSFIGGGQSNAVNALSQWSGVVSGRNNVVNGDYSVILGGGDPNIVDGNAITGNFSAILGGGSNVVNGNYGGAFGYNNSASSDAFAMGTGAIAGPNEFAATYQNGFYFKSNGQGDGTGASGYNFENHVAVFHNPTGNNGILIRLDNSCETTGMKVNNENNFVTFHNKFSQEVGRIEGQTPSEFGNDDEYQQELAFAILDVVVASTDVTLKGYGLVSEAMDVASASSCIFCPQLAIPEASDIVTASIELAMSTAGLVSAGYALDNLKNSKTTNVGVTYQSGAGDYAEYLPKLSAKEKFVSGQIVGVKGGLITKNTDNADQLMVISRKPIVLGNATPENMKGNFEKVAFLGQVPVVVTGAVKLGDYILPDGNHKGLGIAVSPANIKPEQYKQIVGIAWSESKQGQLATEINVAVGLNGLSISKEVSRQNDIIAKQDEQISMLKKVLCTMNTAMGKVDPGYSTMVRTMLGNDPSSMFEVKQVSAPAAKPINESNQESKIHSMLLDDEKAMALYEKSKGTGKNPLMFQQIEQDPEKKARFIQELKERYNQSIYEAMGKQSSSR